MTPPPPAFYVAASDLDNPGRRAWLLGPYPGRPAAEAALGRAVALVAAEPRSPFVSIRVASAPVGVQIRTAFGA